MMRRLLVLLACAAAVLAQDKTVEKALVQVRVDDYARLQAARLFKAGAPVQQLKACRILQPYTLLVSGAIISADGEIVTPALHPRASLRILVTMHDGTTHLAELCGTDSRSGLALVKIPVKTEDFLTIDETPLTHMQEVRVLGYSAAWPVPRVVEALAKIGGLRQPVKMHDLYTGRSRLTAMPIAVTLEAIYPRTGALCVNDAGKLCGLRVSGLPPGQSPDGKKTFEGHFLVPGARIAKVVADLRAHGHVQRALYGVRVGCVPASLRAHFPNLPASAVTVEHVQPGSPGAAGGLQANDVILTLDGKTYTDVFEMWDAMSDRPAGKPVKFDVLRKGKKISIEVTPVADDD